MQEKNSDMKTRTKSTQKQTKTKQYNRRKMKSGIKIEIK